MRACGSHANSGATRRGADSAAIWATGNPVIPGGSSRTEREKGNAAQRPRALPGRGGGSRAGPEAAAAPLP